MKKFENFTAEDRIDVNLLDNDIHYLNGEIDSENIGKAIKWILDADLQIKPKKILIRVPILQRDWTVLKKKEIGIEWRLDKTHEIEYTEKNFKKEMLEAGLKIKKLELIWSEIWCVLE